jgi:predicted acylesterase/phospholipase RssA
VTGRAATETGTASTLAKFLKALAVLYVAAIAVGCAELVEHHPLSTNEYKQTDFSSLNWERFWGDAAPANLEPALRKMSARLKVQYPEAINAKPDTAPVLDGLTISGGGANGAFSAGLLVGWTESGTRRSFHFVTGVSAGAMIAPFAFLGSDYDDNLLKLYASIRRDTVYRANALSGLLFGSALYDTAPLKRLIAKFVTREIIKKIAEQYQLGRSLYIITTHFDALRPMVWNIGAIANRRGDSAVKLIRQIILASAAIPVLFPPIPIEWELDGKRFTELHVDGSISQHIFAYPTQIHLDRLDKAMGLTFRRRIFVIRNGNLQSTYEPASVTVGSIAERALNAILQNQANGDIERIYHLARRDGIKFNMIAIPNTFRADNSMDFDPEYMHALASLGRKIGRRGNFWQDHPPAEQTDR